MGRVIRKNRWNKDAFLLKKSVHVNNSGFEMVAEVLAGVNIKKDPTSHKDQHVSKEKKNVNLSPMTVISNNI